ncbi:transposase [Streptomyces sp. NPDC059441]|uniref:transposase n=1 Tax=Streptomyces sp. NPDC059441 TaxID=3346829 RepID=UPI0036AAE876
MPADVALDLLAWPLVLALAGDTRRWEPKRLRSRLISTAAQFVNTSHHHWLHLPTQWPWTPVITSAMNRLQTLPNPGCPRPTPDGG